MKKLKLTEITPKHLRCGVGPCPAVYRSNRKTLVLVGKRVQRTELNESLLAKIAPHEEIIELPKEFFQSDK